MVAKTWSVAFSGVRSLPVEVQVSLASGLPSFVIVGLGDKPVAESRERIRAALEASGLKLPPKRIVVNLAPADLVKEGSHFDLPIALALLASIGVIESEPLAGILALGELGLDGRIAPVSGILPAAFAAQEARRRLICPRPQAHEASLVEGLEYCAAESLAEIVSHFAPGVESVSPFVRSGGAEWPPRSDGAHSGGEPAVAAPRDLAEVKGQEMARRALEVAAAGGHNMLLIGPPGAGKSLLAHALPGILPPLVVSEALEISKIHSLAGTLLNGGLISSRPFRDPHHSASLAALAGGGARARPGEVSLAHRGVLFLDELPEFSRSTLEALRQPMEVGEVTVSRASAHETYPARFQLVAAMNPCRCGEFGIVSRHCGRAPRCAREYQARVSGPLLDRIDIHVEVAAVPPVELAARRGGESSAVVAERVLGARAVQTERARRVGGGDGAAPHCNAELEGEALEVFCALDKKAHSVLARAAERYRLSARGWNRILRVARTIADLEGEERITAVGVAEALEWRRKEWGDSAAAPP
ncbi:MAG: YifB family Mg chelatase-like AAA ATPase [Alphaproteobacteria bacterium]|nr:YifB family Mg chelatase-like AAA ATPase [Alphaproteobacteria bacterium]MDA8004046.1 YifB family Mg chelatase-like AAA ATPase [Alphaproteobacteria bacterium]MDA8005578.1 YifB family Mg chelatase-like AAA ATPase [Alphaproteobacteria bacterium]MDA8012577.1 YifB family Mg chelatase-like AAA ATPase [Alphaproteobacteria bacterium]